MSTKVIMTDDQRIDYSRIFLVEELRKPNIVIGFVESESDWADLLDMIDADPEFDGVVPELCRRQGVLYPVRGEEGRINVFVCPQLFGTYAQGDDDFKLFLTIWQMRLQIAIVNLGACKIAEQHDYVNAVLRKQYKMSEKFLAFPPY